MGGTNYNQHQNNYGVPPPPEPAYLHTTKTSLPTSNLLNVQNRSEIHVQNNNNSQYESNVSVSKEAMQKYQNNDAPPGSYAKQAEGLPNLPEVVVKAIDSQRTKRKHQLIQH
jgi:hypothetical protein